ncbi:MAG: alpha/beta hydrolase [Phycisphaerae bacterium]|nr:alpha/beta hydrolase [Phycisphaerae bacterium]
MWGCDRLFYYPDARIRGTPADHDLAYEDVFFDAADGVRLHGWFLPARGGPARGTVVHLHGNAANITGHFEFMRWLPDAGYHLLVFDYRGYGRSSGTVTRNGTVFDAEAAIDYAVSRPEVNSERLFLMGQSLGGAVAIVTAARHPGRVRGLVVDGAFTRYRDIARHHVLAHPLTLVVGWWYPLVLSGEHDPLDDVAAIAPTPIFIMHGAADRVVPARMARELFEAAAEPKQLWIAEGMDHYQVWLDRFEEARGRVLRFFEEALAGD